MQAVLISLVLAGLVGILDFGKDFQPPPPPPGRSPSPAAARIPLLEVTVGNLVGDGHLMRVRGTVRNPLAQPIQGIRLVLYLLTRPAADSEVLETLQSEMPVTLGPGESTAIRWDVESIYLSGGGFALRAYPKRRDQQHVPPPPDWRS
jgi:hypothetical protein